MENEKPFSKQKSPLFISDSAKKVINRLLKNNVEAYFVGGCVRDSILGRPVSDFDITTAATPNEVVKLFSDMRVVETGIKHGTVTVISNGEPLEVTTYRTDGEYADNRHPNKVVFTKNILEDLKRRDFTVNAICYREDIGYYDPFGGISDIEKKIIKTVGAADERFKEDSLRILRALRFASVLGFSIEKETENAIFTLAELINNVSAERIFVELKKTLLGDLADEVFNKYFKVFARGISRLKEKEEKCFNFSPLRRTQKDIASRLAAFIIIIGEDALFSQRLLCALKSDNKTKSDVAALIRAFKSQIPKNSYDIKILLKEFEKENTKKLLTLLYSFDRITKEEFQNLEDLLSNILATKECYSLKGLKINGKDLLELGAKDKKVGELLNLALLKVIRGEIQNNRSELIEFTKKALKEVY